MRPTCSGMVDCDEPSARPVDAGESVLSEDAGSPHVESETDIADGGVSRDAGHRARANRRRHPGCSTLPDRERNAGGLAALALQLAAATLAARAFKRRRGD